MKFPHHRHRNIKVTVIVSQAEYDELRREAAFVPSGTVSGAMRVRMRFNSIVFGKDRPIISEAQYRWEQDGKIGPMPKEE